MTTWLVSSGYETQLCKLIEIIDAVKTNMRANAFLWRSACASV